MSSFSRLLCLAALALPLAGRAQIAAHVVRANIAGIDVIAYHTGVEELVTLRGALPAGDFFSPPDNPAIATLVAGMLDKGTTKQDKFALAAKLDAIGARISFGASDYDATFAASCMKRDLPLVIALLAEQLRTPAFAPEELTKFKKQLAGAIKRQLEDTNYRADDAFSRAAYPVGHPNRQPTADEMLAGIEAAKVEDLRAFHAAHYGPAHLTMVGVGDLEPAQLQAEIQKTFAGWTGGDAPLPAMPNARAGGVDTAKEQTVSVPGKTSVSVVWGGATGLRYRDTDALALRVATAIFGSGFTGRLMGNVRDKEGLTYGIGATVGNDTFATGDWRITATFAPALLARGIDSTKKQLTLWHESGVTADELNRRKTELVGNYQVSLSTTTGLASALLLAVQRGVDLGWLDEYPNRIKALSLDEVNGAIKKYVDPDKLVLIEAGTLPTTN